MKKLFFAALFAAVAVGGAVAQEYQSQSAPQFTFNCDGEDDPTCESAAPGLPWTRLSDSATIASPPADYDETYEQITP